MTPRDALKLAIQLHAGQKDKAGRPYWEHCQRVQDRLKLVPEADSIALIAAALHDVIEDGQSDWRTLLGLGVPRDAVVLVETLTRDEEESYDWYLVRVKQNPRALLIKLADIADNSDPLRLMLLEPDVREKLRAKYNKALDILLA